jgi:hypothetical protein
LTDVLGSREHPTPAEGSEACSPARSAVVDERDIAMKVPETEDTTPIDVGPKVAVLFTAKTHRGSGTSMTVYTMVRSKEWHIVSRTDTEGPLPSDEELRLICATLYGEAEQCVIGNVGLMEGLFLKE